MHDTLDFRAGVEAVVRLGGDADTNGAVTGALLGARFGAGASPQTWLENVEDGRELREYLG